MIGNAPQSEHTGVPGWETSSEQAYLLQLAERVPAGGTIVELGSEFGMSSSLFAKGAAKDVRIVSVDLFPGELLTQHKANLTEAGFGDRTEPIQGDSPAVGKAWKDGVVHLLFVDGDHSYEGVKADIAAWVKHVPVKGVVAFHDCANPENRMPHYLHFEVTRAVSEWFWSTKGTWKNIAAVDTLLAFERVK